MSRGVSLPEALVGLLLGALVIHLALDSLGRAAAARARLEAGADVVTSLRTVRHLLRRELRFGRPGTDWVVSPDSISLRAFRGTGLVCSRAAGVPELVVLYSGDRRPDPAKDSVLLVGAGGALGVAALEGVGAAPSGCPGPATTLRLDLEPPPGVLAAKVFERGSYHLVDRALRYRRGASGRQPLTPEVWASGSGWTWSGARWALDLLPESRGRSGGAAWAGFLAAQ